MTSASRKKARYIEPHRWSETQLHAVGATLSSQCQIPASDPAEELISAILNTSRPYSPAFMDLFPTAELGDIAIAAYYSKNLDPTLPRSETEVRRRMCINLINCTLSYLCPHYHFLPQPLKLHCGKATISWEPRGYIGAHVWLVVPQNPKSHFAEETAFAISIAQEFHVGKTEQEFEVWLVSVRRDKAAIVHATVSGALLAALDRTEASKLQPGLAIGQFGDVKVQASNEYCLRDTTERTVFMGVLDGVANWANSRTDEQVRAVSWK